MDRHTKPFAVSLFFLNYPEKTTFKLAARNSVIDKFGDCSKIGLKNYLKPSE
jgi:hypothetical protein